MRKALWARAEVNASGKYGYTPLHDAATRGRTAIVQALLAAGADISVQTQFDKTPEDIAEGACKSLLREAREARASMTPAPPPTPVTTVEAATSDGRLEKLHNTLRAQREGQRM